MGRARYLLAAFAVVLLVYGVRGIRNELPPSSSGEISKPAAIDQTTPATPLNGQPMISIAQKSPLPSVPASGSQSIDTESKSPNSETPSPNKSKPLASESDSFPTTEQARELAAHTWGGGGFKPPSTPGFDELFRDQRKRNGFTYWGLSLKDGVYLVYFSESERAKPLLFQASLKQTTHNNRTGFLAEWIQFQGAPRISLNDFSSAYTEREIYYGFLNLPTNVFTDGGYPLQNCSEVLAIRHFDYDPESSHQNSVTFFNARAYCRTDLDELRFIGRMGFQYLRP